MRSPLDGPPPACDNSAQTPHGKAAGDVMSTAPIMKRPKTQDERDLLLYESRLQRPVRMKTPEFERNGRIRHVIFSGQFSVPFLEELGGIADMIRMLSKSRAGQDFLINLLPHKRAMLYFTQPSTRTFLSFMAACQILGITCNEVRDPSTSSETKGETRFDSIRMFSSYFDTIIMRSPIARLAESCAYLMNDLDASGSRSVPIINAGSGADEHPTQALLDIYTLQRSFQFTSPKDSPAANRFDELRQQWRYTGLTKGLAHKTYGFCGDIGRGRTVRSLAMLLALYEDVRLVFIAPDHPKLVMRDDLRERLVDRNVRFYEFESFEDQLDGQPGDRAARRAVHDANPEGAQRSAGRGDAGQHRLLAVLPHAGAGLADERVRADPASVPARPALRRNSAGDRQRPAGDVLPPGPQRHVDSGGPAWPTSSTWTISSRAIS